MSTSYSKSNGIGVVTMHLNDGNSIDRANALLAGISNGGGAIKAVHAALVRAGATAKTKAGQFAAQEYTMKKSSFMVRTKVKTHVDGGFWGASSVRIQFAGRVIPLLEFNTRYANGGLFTQIKRANSGEALEHAFAAPVYGQTAVFEHVDKTRGPLRQKFGPSTAHMLQNEDVIERMDKAMQETFDKRIDHEISRILHGWGGKA